MSSPIASPKKRPLGSALITVHQKLSHTHRIEILALHIENSFMFSILGQKR